MLLVNIHVPIFALKVEAGLYAPRGSRGTSLVLCRSTYVIRKLIRVEARGWCTACGVFSRCTNAKELIKSYHATVGNIYFPSEKKSHPHMRESRSCWRPAGRPAPETRREADQSDLR